MATRQSTSRKPAHTEAGPDIAPHGREVMMEAHRGRREAEPAAAAMETDAESGGASAVSATPDGKAPEDPAQKYLNEGAEGRAEPEADAAAHAAGGAWLKWVIGALIVLALIYAAVQI